jgi:phosphohistidine phosphatase SixA
MKTLIIVRHAKSSWANPDQTDFERPLNDRGNRDAPEMAKRLLEMKSTITHPCQTDHCLVKTKQYKYKNNKLTIRD